MTLEQYYGTGRRKSSTARVYLRPGKGGFIVNRTDIKQYFNRDSLKLMINQPLELVGLTNKFDILVNVKGGGKAGQAGAVRLGIARSSKPSSSFSSHLAFESTCARLMMLCTFVCMYKRASSLRPKVLRAARAP